MLLFNPTDDTLQHSAAVRDPIINGGHQQDFPPKTFIFTPGLRLNVPDAAAEVLLAHLGPRGLVEYPLEGDVEEAKRKGRLAWFQWCDRQRRRHISLNQSQRQKGLEMIEPNDDVLRAFRNYKRLKAGEFADEIMLDADATTASMTPAEEAELQGTYEQNSAAARAAALADQGDEVPPPV